MVHLHLEGYALRPSSLAVAAANVRLLAVHPQTATLHRNLQHITVDDALSDAAYAALHHTMRTRHGYTGSIRDLRRLHDTTPPLADERTLQMVQEGRLTQWLVDGAERIERAAQKLERGASPARYTPVPFAGYRVRPAYDPSEGVAPCDVFAVFDYSLQFLCIVFAMSGAGAVFAGIFMGMGVFFSMIRSGACS